MKIFNKFIFSLFLSSIIYANTNISMKNCEKIPLSTDTILVSCHKIDYIVEYIKVGDFDDEKNIKIKRLIAITPKDTRVIIGK